MRHTNKQCVSIQYEVSKKTPASYIQFYDSITIDFAKTNCNNQALNNIKEVFMTTKLPKVIETVFYLHFVTFKKVS